jgi:hypothetical protein
MILISLQTFFCGSCKYVTFVLLDFIIKNRLLLFETKVGRYSHRANMVVMIPISYIFLAMWVAQLTTDS